MDQIVIIGGATATGKSKIAVDLSRKLADKYGIKSEIINADSMQVYNELKILTAQPDLQDKTLPAHHMYSIINPGDSMNVVTWNKMATELIESLHSEDILPIVVGGTGFYINSLIDGPPVAPQVSSQVREYVKKTFDIYGRDEFYKRLIRIDYRTQDRIEKNDTQRLLRAYEVYEATGRSIFAYADKSNGYKPKKSTRFVVNMDRNLNLKLIESRIKEMLNNGALEEVEAYSKKFGQPSGLNNALGYREFLAHIRGEMSLEEATELCNIRTRQYAKRQVTWFRNKLENAINLSFDSIEVYNSLVDKICAKLKF